VRRDDSSRRAVVGERVGHAALVIAYRNDGA
jgi:hypothetical protein